MKNEVLKTDKNNNFSLNSVNGGHSFLSKTNYDFFKYKLHPTQQQFTGFEIYDCRNSGGATDWNSNSDSRLL